MPTQILSEINLLDPQSFSRDLALRWEPSVAEALALDFSQSVPIEHAQQHLSADILLSLEVCDDTLHRYRRGADITESDSERIKAKIEELEADLESDPDIEPVVLEFLLRHTKAMARGLREIPIRGAAGLQEALSAGIGDQVLRPDLAEKAGPRRRDMLIGLFAAVAAATQFGGGLAQLDQVAQSNRADQQQQSQFERFLRAIEPQRALPPPPAGSAPADDGQ